MAHFARINEDNIVTEIITISNDEILDLNGNESESIGIQLCKTIYNDPESNWVQTSYNSNIRNKYAGIGDIYIPDRDIFVEGQPYDSWLFDDENLIWNPPVPYPDDYNQVLYYWDEDDLSWKIFETT